HVQDADGPAAGLAEEAGGGGQNFLLEGLGGCGQSLLIYFGGRGHPQLEVRRLIAQFGRDWLVAVVVAHFHPKVGRVACASGGGYGRGGDGRTAQLKLLGQGDEV